MAQKEEPYRGKKKNETKNQFFEKTERMDNLQSDLLENKNDINDQCQLYVYLKKLKAQFKKSVPW